MEMEKPGLTTFEDIKKYSIKLVKVMQNQRRHRKPLNMVDAYQGQGEQLQQEQFEQQVENEYELETEAGLQEILSMDLAPIERAAEINAFMQKQFNQRAFTLPAEREADRRSQASRAGSRRRGRPVPRFDLLLATERTCSV